MALTIEDYALISDCHTAALVGADGSVDWLCLPRYDSSSIFAALLGDESHGRWLLAPADPSAVATRGYRGDTFVLSTRWATDDGEVEVVDFMPHGDGRADLVRRVRGIRGTVVMHEALTLRFGYATAVPWVRQVAEPGGSSLVAIAGPDAVVLRGPELSPDDHRHTADFEVREGETIDLVLTWFRSHRSVPAPIEADRVQAHTERWWQDWARNCSHDGPYHDEVIRSLLVLRALTHEKTGGIVAAATTSLPETFGGNRNWDYRYVWLRDAALTLEVLLGHGFEREANDWRAWLLRAIAGDPGDVQIMYGLSGERYLAERELPSLPGYQGASPVRIGNGAFQQFQGDVIGEVMVALHTARQTGVEESQFSWPLQRALMGQLEATWMLPDHGIWEIRGDVQHFTHSRAMIWAALDRAVRAVTEHGFEGPVERWAQLRDQVRDEIESQGVDPVRGCYVQHYGTTEVDASLLQLAQVGYCAPDDPRMLATVAAIEQDLLQDGLVMRYRTESGVDGLPPGENPFLACSFWMVEQYARSGRVDDATALMDRLVGFANDVGLLSEEYDVGNDRQAGNTPQALSHLALVRAADAIAEARGIDIHGSHRNASGAASV
ncbi:glycoside hydrolase family 15 protein [Compostimonas suwonensis]|uniref:GH15 family glucan-1,4-alpha-glucosidase n=1 Tax=Compostimonas suwonensis TaxID=1048394 RepID=A0A2M9BBE7_9MICO|nr:glycoside hydrolase family 15 protein [Compostimonas suwonensis]PJJ55266.1 GH15 family glucan-1,4-alpha-glucosidase [Compostimonas suwonensis]